MRFARVHKAAAYILAALGLVALCSGQQISRLTLGVLGLAVAASWFAEGPLLLSTRYNRTWNVVVVLALILETARGVLFGVAPLNAAVEFAALLQVSRLAQRRTAQDYQQITALALLHLIAATVLGGGLSYALCFLGFVIVMPWAMTLGHLRREIEGNYLADARAGRAGGPIDVARILRSRRVVGPGLLIGSSLMALPVFAITAVVFVLFPRIGLGIFSLRGAHGGPSPGLGDEVELRGHGTIRDDPTIVLRIEPWDLGLHPPPLRAFRMRGAVFDHYDGHTWRRTGLFRSSVVVPDAGMFALQAYPDGPAYREIRVTLDPLEPPVVLLPEGSVAFRVEPRIEAGMPQYPPVSEDRDGATLRYAGADDLGLAYTAFVGPPQSPTVLGDEARARYLQLPEADHGEHPISARTLALSHQLTDGLPNTPARAEAVMRYLSRFRYTLDLVSGDAAEPLEDFLFRSRAGHCEYFSTAMAVLLRAAGIPTRNVTGFLGGTYNHWGRFYAVHQGDAHSWVEVYDDARRSWLVYDPTPPAREVPTVSTGMLAEMDALIEAMRIRWRRYIVSFDLGTQTRLLSRVARYLEPRTRRAHRSGPDERAIGAKVRRWIDEERRPLGLALVLGVSVASGVWWWRRRRRAIVAPNLPATRSVREAVGLAIALDAALIERGHVRPKTRSPMGYAEDLVRAGASMGPVAAKVAARYAAARFGHEAFAPGELESLKRTLREPLEPPQA